MYLCIIAYFPYKRHTTLPKEMGRCVGNAHENSLIVLNWRWDISNSIMHRPDMDVVVFGIHVRNRWNQSRCPCDSWFVQTFCVDIRFDMIVLVLDPITYAENTITWEQHCKQRFTRYGTWHESFCNHLINNGPRLVPPLVNVNAYIQYTPTLSVCSASSPTCFWSAHVCSAVD